MIRKKFWGLIFMNYALTLYSYSDLYQTVGKIVLEGEDHISENFDQKYEDMKEGIKEQAENITIEIDDFLRKQLFFNLISRKSNLQNEYILKPYSLRELNLIIGTEQSRKNNLYKTIDHTETTIGSAVLAAILSNPIADIQIIRRRQNLINFLLNNEEIFSKLNTLISVIKTIESSILNNWNPGANLDKNLEKIFYFSKNSQLDSLNKNSLIHQFNHCLSILQLSMSCVFMVAMPIGCTVLGSIFNINPEIEDIRQGIKYSDAAVGLLVGLLYDAIIFFYTKSALENYNIRKTVSSGLHKRLNDINQIDKVIVGINELIESEIHLKEGLNFKNNSADLSIIPEELAKNLIKLQELLQKPIFDKKFTMLSNVGNIFAAYYYMQELKDHFILPLEAIGEIDAYLSMVKLIKEHKEKSVGYCFVDFIDQNEPFIDLKDVWNPLIATSNVKPIDITLGNNQPNNLLLTGPHGGGKSTLMKSIAFSSILGQTFGIAPAKKARLTLFDRIFSSVNIGENLGKDLSGFMSEKFRAEEILKGLANLDENQKAIIIMDEPFRGTMEDEGSIRAYEFGLETSKYKNTICLMATHFRKVTELEEDTSAFTNYHFEIIEEMKDNFLRTFNLLQGKCEWWYNDPEKRRRYINFALINN